MRLWLIACIMKKAVNNIFYCSQLSESIDKSTGRFQTGLQSNLNWSVKLTRQGIVALARVPCGVYCHKVVLNC